MSSKSDRARLDFEVYASGVKPNGEKFMTEADLMQVRYLSKRW